MFELSERADEAEEQEEIAALYGEVDKEATSVGERIQGETGDLRDSL